MSRRLPKPGEVWRTLTNTPMTVVNVYPDAVTYRYAGHDSLHAAELEYWVANATPPEPTVIGTRWLSPNAHSTVGFYADESTCWQTATHRLDLMSDGEFRVVKL